MIRKLVRQLEFQGKIQNMRSLIFTARINSLINVLAMIIQKKEIEKQILRELAEFNKLTVRDREFIGIRKT